MELLLVVTQFELGWNIQRYRVQIEFLAKTFYTANMYIYSVEMGTDAGIDEKQTNKQTNNPKTRKLNKTIF